jgi:hypothetical protein
MADTNSKKLTNTVIICSIIICALLIFQIIFSEQTNRTNFNKTQDKLTKMQNDNKQRFEFLKQKIAPA